MHHLTMRGRTRTVIFVVAVCLLGLLHLWNSPLMWRVSAAPSTVNAVQASGNSKCVSEAGSLTVAAVLRNQGSGWFAISDEGHSPINVTSLDTDDRFITVRFPFKATRVNTFLVTPDETLASQGYFAGASVGLDNAKIKLSQATILGAAERSPLGVSAPNSNLWIYGRFEGACP